MSIKYRATLCGMVIGPRGKPLKLWNNTHGYPSFTRVVAGRRRATTAHRFIFEFFHGPIPEGLVVNHKDGNKENNKLSNLEAVSQYENVVHGGGTTLSHEDVTSIRGRLHEKQEHLAKEFGVSQSTISDIKRRKSHGSY